MGKIFYKGVDYSSPTSSGVSGVKGNKETVYRVGNVNITPANVGALAENGDSKDNTVTFTSNDTSTSDAWEDVTVLASKEKHSSLFGKISTMFKNVRYIYTHFIKSENILETLEEIVANTQSGKVAGALAVKELNSSLTYTSTKNFIFPVCSYEYSGTHINSIIATFPPYLMRNYTISCKSVNIIGVGTKSITSQNTWVNGIEICCNDLADYKGYMARCSFTFTKK